MKQRINAGEQFPELLISNYDMYERQRNKPLQLSLLDLTTEQQIDFEQILKECILRKHRPNLFTHLVCIFSAVQPKKFSQYDSITAFFCTERQKI